MPLALSAKLQYLKKREIPKPDWNSFQDQLEGICGFFFQIFNLF
jgi:hypothetical protein